MKDAEPALEQIGVELLERDTGGMARAPPGFR
jgi:hypothetical protein